MPLNQPLFLGVEIGGTKLQLGLGDRDGSLIALKRGDVRVDQGASGIRDRIGELADELFNDHKITSYDLAAIGVGFGGPVDVAEGRVIASHQIEGWTNYPLAVWFRERFGVDRVAIQNDADTAALAESVRGCGFGRSPVVYVTIGSGVGGGLVVDGSIYRGNGLWALEIGHLLIDDPDRPGVKLELEQIASGWSIGRAAREIARRSLKSNSDIGMLYELSNHQVEDIDARLVARAASSGDPISLAVLDRARRAFAAALADVVLLVAPERIILGGGVSLIGEALWFEPIRNELDRLLPASFRRRFDVVPASLGENVVVVGALESAKRTLDQIDQMF
jgi:glucokinase